VDRAKLLQAFFNLRRISVLRNLVNGRPQKFFLEGGNVDILLILFRLPAVQRKWNFTKRFTLPFLHHKEMPYVTATVTKLCFIGSVDVPLTVTHKHTSTNCESDSLYAMR